MTDSADDTADVLTARSNVSCVVAVENVIFKRVRIVYVGASGMLLTKVSGDTARTVHDLASVVALTYVSKVFTALNSQSCRTGRSGLIVLRSICVEILNTVEYTARMASTLYFTGINARVYLKVVIKRLFRRIISRTRFILI